MELDAYLARIKPQQLTPHTVTDKSLLKAMIITDRVEGYSLVDQEAEAGFRSIAVPVRRQSRSMVCALAHRAARRTRQRGPLTG